MPHVSLRSVTYQPHISHYIGLISASYYPHIGHKSSLVHLTNKVTHHTFRRCTRCTPGQYITKGKPSAVRPKISSKLIFASRCRFVCDLIYICCRNFINIYIYIIVEDRVVDTYRRSSTRMRERTRHRSGNIRFRVTSGVTRHRRR